jgi:nucleotide-binding universal stress UspA family protein
VTPTRSPVASKEEDTPIGTPLVVVGIDGSPCSQEALAFAVEEARMRRARLQIVAAWQIPGLAYTGGAAVIVDPQVFERAADEARESAVLEAHRIGGGLEVDAVTVEESPAAALLEAAGGADLLVVGSRGHGGFASLLLGSVSHQVVMHASCPVAIVHARA